MKSNIVSVEWLSEHLTDPNLIILDASPKSNVGGLVSANEDAQIAGARYFDLKGKFVDKESDFPNTVPSEEQFQAESRKLGINKNAQIIVYDNLGIYTSPRVWWLYKTMGHEKVAVLDGGLPEWVKHGGKTQEKSEQQGNWTEGDFQAQFNSDVVKSYEDIVENSTSAEFCVVDARSQGRFEGVDPEPRKELQSGSIPHSVSIPFKQLLVDGKFKSIDELRQIFTDKTDGETDLVFSCGSGLTACIVMLACEVAFKKNRYLFDGSWTEWATRQKLFT